MTYGPDDMLAQNKHWANKISEDDPNFFRDLSAQQTPKFMWIGCSDSRVPANQIVEMRPGEVFVHRNVANIFSASDLNALSTLQFAVDVLKVEHVIVCGHYGCGGVLAALRDDRHGLVDHWLRQVQIVRDHHREDLDALPDEAARHARLCELNVMSQVQHLVDSYVARDAWERGQALSVHGWIYGLSNGLLRDLKVTVSGKRGEGV